MNSAGDIFWLLGLPIWTAVGIVMIVTGRQVRSLPEPANPAPRTEVLLLGCTCPDCLYAASRFGAIRPTPVIPERIAA